MIGAYHCHFQLWETQTFPEKAEAASSGNMFSHHGVTMSTAPVSRPTGLPSRNEQERTHTHASTHVHMILKSYFWLLGRSTCHFLCPRQPAGLAPFLLPAPPWSTIRLYLYR